MKYLIYLLYCLPILTFGQSFSNAPLPAFQTIAINRLPRTGVYAASLRNNLVPNKTIELSVDAYENGDERHIMLQLISGTSTIIGQYFVDDLYLPGLRNVQIADLNNDGRKDFKIATAQNANLYTIHYFFQESDGNFKGMSFESICIDATCRLERDLNRDGYFDVLQITEERIQNQMAMVYTTFKPEPQHNRMRNTSRYFNYPKAYATTRQELRLSEERKNHLLSIGATNFKLYPKQQTTFRLASRCKNENETCRI